jgi:hypothetical protein
MSALEGTEYKILCGRIGRNDTEVSLLDNPLGDVYVDRRDGANQWCMMS